MDIRNQTTLEAKKNILDTMGDSIGQKLEDWSKFSEWSDFVHNTATTEIEMFIRETKIGEREPPDEIVLYASVLQDDVSVSKRFHQNSISMIIQKIKKLQDVKTLDEAMVTVANLKGRITNFQHLSTERHEIMENSLRNLMSASASMTSPWKLSVGHMLALSRSGHNSLCKYSDDYMGCLYNELDKMER